MGLHNTAHYLKSKGRGTDTELVHMSKNEIKGLQQLAMAHGGSLTINPDTGLVEAGFLEQALPIVAAAAATYFTAGAAAPYLVGALGTTGAGIVAGAGAGALISGATAAMTGKDVGKAALTGGIGGALAGGIGAYGDAGSVGAEATQKAAIEGGTTVVNPGTPSSPVDYNAGLSGTSPTVPTPTPTPTPAPQSGGLTVNEMIAGSGRPELSGTVNNFDPYAKLSGENLGAQTAQKTFYQGLEPNGVGRGLVQMLPTAGLLEQQPRQQTGPESQKGIGLGMSPNFQRYEPQTPNPYYRAKYPTYAAEGGIMQSYAAGGNVAAAPTGPVERLSQNVMGGQSNMYPQSQQTQTKFATPTQMPVSSEMMTETPAYERSNPMLMAEGGQVKGYAPGGQIDMGNGYNPFANLPELKGPLGSVGGGQRPAGMQPMGVSNGVNPFSPERMAALRNDPQFTKSMRVSGGGYDEQGRPVNGLGNLINSNISQPTGQSMYPSATAMQSGFGQGAQGYSSFSSGSSGGGGGPFPLEGQYGIIKMASGGIARYANRGQVNVLQDYLGRQEQQQMSPLSISPNMPDVGIFRDTDVDTARKDALTAAMIRLGKTGKGAGIKPIALPKTSIKGLGDIRGATPEIEEAAAGGTMRYNLGGYSDGGRMLKGPGDGMSDSIPASIAGKQPARLADGEFVVPADVVSHLGNGSTDAGAKKLYLMMDKIRRARTGKKKQAPAVKADKFMPA